MGKYYLDGPVFLKSNVSLLGRWSEGASPYETQLEMHGSSTGADGLINADGVSGVVVSTYEHNLYEMVNIAIPWDKNIVATVTAINF